MSDKIFTFSFTARQVDIIAAALNEVPGKFCNEVLPALQAQIAQQQEAKTPPAQVTE